MYVGCWTYSLSYYLLTPSGLKGPISSLRGLAASCSYLCSVSLLCPTPLSHLSSSLIFFPISNSDLSSPNHLPNSLHSSSQFLLQLAHPNRPLRPHPYLTFQSHTTVGFSLLLETPPWCHDPWFTFSSSASEAVSSPSLAF